MPRPTIKSLERQIAGLNHENISIIGKFNAVTDELRAEKLKKANTHEADRLRLIGQIVQAFSDNQKSLAFAIGAAKGVDPF